VPKDSYAHIEDKQLLDKFYNEGNNYWLGILLQRYTLLLFGVCMKYLKNEEDAKDSVQQIYLKVVSELQKYKVDYFKSWLYMIARNHCLMKIRDRQGKIPVELSDELLTPEEANNKQELIEKDKTLALLEEGLQELSEEQRLCLTLFYLEKKSYHEIADVTGYTLLQVKSFIQNGKRNLKLIVEKKMKKANG
jgi:RNA polymerase sigma-70 factor (ECF subfamily)